MSRPRKPSDIIADYRNIQHTAHNLRLSESDQRDIKKLAERYGSKDPRATEKAITVAINSARIQANMAKISQAEYQAIYREQARRAKDMLEFVDFTFQDGRFGAGNTFFTDLIFEGIEENTAEAFQGDPLFIHRKQLTKLLTLIEQRSDAIAERIDPADFRHNEAHHVLGRHLMEAARNAAIPITPSASKTSRMARLFEDAAQIAGLEPGDPSKYLKDA